MNSVNFDLTCPSLDNLSQTSEYGSADSSLTQGYVPEGGKMVKLNGVAIK